MSTEKTIVLPDGTKATYREIHRVEGFDEIEKYRLNQPKPFVVGSGVHELKTDPVPFSAVWRGEKTHEIRYDDRGYQVGDRLVLKELIAPIREIDYDVENLFTGRYIDCTVTHIQRGYGLQAGWCVLSIKITNLFYLRLL